MGITATPPPPIGTITALPGQGGVTMRNRPDKSPGKHVKGLTDFSVGIRLLAALLSSSVHIRLWQESKDQ